MPPLRTGLHELRPKQKPALFLGHEPRRLSVDDAAGRRRVAAVQLDVNVKEVLEGAGQVVHQQVRKHERGGGVRDNSVLVEDPHVFLNSCEHFVQLRALLQPITV
ncbi:hypothetical protein KL905_004616 [Ogataea polymorpha]|nr:hypothetical protein KL907_004542 [Ogataea polymorpha]KAG7914495.1 hypothetical protein KL927_004689 [Ogataea polymorpha]KAG7916886.1 hypothetical protein KL905_004616 [Ogataea polymorpha]